MEDIYFMKEALNMARKGLGRTSPNPVVGAVIVNDNHIAGRGYHAYPGGPHAEIEALGGAGGEASGATMYVTLEPCCHHGKTGPCTEAIINAGISRVVIAATDPNPLVSGKGVKQLIDAGIEVKTGVMEKEALRLNEVFNKFITTRLPFVIAKAATSLDGKIATSIGESRWITGVEAREKVHEFRDIYDAILVGIGTVLEDDPSLTTRLKNKSGKDPVRLVLDSKAKTPPGCKMLTQESNALTYIITGKNASREKVDRLQDAGARVVKTEVDCYGKIDLTLLLKWLGEQEITSVLVEGGAGVHGSFFYDNLVDKVLWFIAPKIIGGVNAPGPVGGYGFERMRDVLSVKDMEFNYCGEDLLVMGYPEKEQYRSE